MFTRRRTSIIALLVLGFAAILTWIVPSEAKDPLALTGYDPVSYFTGSKPAKGKAEFTADHRGQTYRFASAENRDAFSANPTQYAPQYDGYCAYGVSRGYKVGVDPLAYKVVDGKLYVNYSKSVQKTWSKDIAGYISKAEQNWSSLK